MGILTLEESVEHEVVVHGISYDLGNLLVGEFHKSVTLRFPGLIKKKKEIQYSLLSLLCFFYFFYHLHVSFNRQVFLPSA